jgi:hypothetical protein
VTTGNHILHMTSTGKVTTGTKRELLTAKCSCGRWDFPQNVREVLREEHALHLDEIVVKLRGDA